MSRRNALLPSLLGATAAGLFGAHLYRTRARRFALKGKVALITGGSRGLGLVIARELVSRGAKVAILARDQGELDRAAIDLRSRGGDVMPLVCDVSDREALIRAIADISNALGPIDVLINNAGIMQIAPMELMSLDDFERAMGVHFWASLYACLEVVPSMRARRSGRVVNIASIGGKITVPHMLPYTASKFALTGLSHGLRTELVKDGVYVTTVCPSPLRTGSTINVEVKGRHREEYAWFVLTDSIPIVSVGAERAGRRIVRALERGDAELILGVGGKLAAKLAGLLPGLTSALLATVDRWIMPRAGGIGARAVLGRDSESPVTRSVLTHLNQRAAERNNEW